MTQAFDTTTTPANDNRPRAFTRRERNIRAVLEHMTYTPDEIQLLMREDQRHELVWHLERICGRLTMRGWGSDLGHWTYQPAIHKTARILYERELKALEDEAHSPY